MKKLLLIMCAVLFSVTLVSCGLAGSTDDAVEEDGVFGDFSWVLEETEEVQDPALPDDGGGIPGGSAAEQPDAPAENTNQEWRTFLKEYEAWVDEYVIFMKKYKANPTDFSLLADYAKMSAKAVEFTNKASDIQGQISASDLAEYTQTLARITQKISEVAY